MTRPSVLAVGQPMAPDKKRFAALCEEMIESGWYSNDGQLHARLSKDLSDLWGVREHGGALALTSSGTMALMMALHLGDMPKGAEIITSPLSFPATVQAIAWCGFTPVFADVDPERLTLCPKAVRKAITPQTAGVLGVHLTGVPCDHAGLESVAKDNGLWLAYDAAQSVDIMLEDGPLWCKGDASAVSLHATKLLHSCEGGAVLTSDRALKPKLDRLRRFGLQNGKMTDLGTNGKMSELHAAMALALLPDLERETYARKALREQYDTALTSLAQVRPHSFPALGSASLMYYAVRLPGDMRDAAQLALLSQGVITRPGFPLLCGAGTLFRGANIATGRDAPVAPEASRELLCLPLHSQVTNADVERIAGCLSKVLG